MATSGQGIWKPLGEGSVGNYQHASQIFRTNNYARAPKSKYLFYVNIKINPGARAINVDSDPNPSGKNELSYLVKSVDLPKFDMQVQELNQYNRKVLIQQQIKYNPVTIKFHDDNQGSLRKFWKSYYTFYYADGRYIEGFYSVDDKYKARGATSKTRWGFDTGVKTHYLSTIEIFSFHHGKAQKIILHNPIISSFAHDSHEYATNDGVMEATMTVQYTGVEYVDNLSIKTSVPGFGLDFPEAYDVRLSDLTDGSGNQVDPKTGEVYDPDADQEVSVDDIAARRAELVNQQGLVYNNYNPTAPNFVTNQQLSAILQNASQFAVNTSFLFPSINTINPIYGDFGAVEIPGSVSSSDGQSVSTPQAIIAQYPAGSWQNTLYNKGYNTTQISAAQKYFNESTVANGVNVVAIAEKYITSNDFTASSYGQSASKPAQIDFNSPSTATQPVYNSQDWRSQLSTKGYTSAELAVAERFLATVKVAPGASLGKIAENYINKVKSSGGSTVGPVRNRLPIISTPAGSSIPLRGPSYNPAGDQVFTGGTPFFDETTGTYRPV